MITTFSIRRGDLDPPIRPTLEYSDGSPIDLAGVSSVKLLMRRPGTYNTIEKTAEVYDAENGVVQYAWVAGDTDTPGDYEAEWEVTFANGSKFTAPNRTKTHIMIFDDLN